MPGRMLASLYTVVSLSLVVTASWDGNLNFNSPSLQHRDLGLDVAKIQKRTGMIARQTANFTDSQLNFTHGVASGDPYSDSVILWTRLAPSLASDRSNVTVSGTAEFYNHETEEYIRASKHRVCTQWRVASDANLTCVVDQGTAYTTSDIDFTIKVSLLPVSVQVCSNPISGRGAQTAPVHHILLSVHSMRFNQPFSCRTY
jgi:alkaline phosphatase D